MQKIISSIIICAMLVVIIGPSYIANAESNISKITGFQELNSNHFQVDGETHLNGAYKDQRTNDIHEFDIIDNDKLRQVKHFINNEFQSESIYNKKTGIIISKDSRGVSNYYNKSELVTIENKKNNLIGLSNDEFSPMNSNGGWTLAQSKYSSTWGKWGYLWTKDTWEDAAIYELQLSVGTLVTTILSIIELILTKGSLTAILKTLGYTIFGSMIDTAIYGQLGVTKYKTDVQVISQSEVGLISSHYTIVAEMDGKTAKTRDGGDERSYDELLDLGIYLVVLNNLN